MASGHGIAGGPGRCYSFWVEFTKCVGESIFPRECNDYRDDYIECLHHPKEAERRKAIHEQAKRKEKLDKAAAARDFVAASTSATENSTKPSSQ